MNLAFGVIFLWLGAALMWYASHGSQATTPWGAFQSVISRAVPDGVA